MNNLGIYVKNKREEKALSLRGFAQMCGLSHSYIDNIEKGYDQRTKKPISPTLEALIKISKGLDVSLGDFLTATGYAENDFIRHGSPVSSLKKEADLVNLLAYYTKAEKKNLNDEEYKAIEDFAKKWWENHPEPQNDQRTLSNIEFSFMKKYRKLPIDARKRIDNQLNFEYEQSRKG